MPTLEPPPLQLELPAVSFFGRPFEEYARFFALDPPKLSRRAVLDVAAGPSSFTAEASRRGVDAVAVDPLYSRSVAELGAQIRQDYGQMCARMRARPQLFRLDGADLPARGLEKITGQGTRAAMFRSFAAAETDRRSAAQCFLADYEGNVRHGRYVRGALPLLPFLDGAFDLVLCAHLLFIYAARFDFAWHVEACVELARVSGGEARIHPVCEADGRPYAGLKRLRRELLARGVHSMVVPVDYEFFRGGNSMLVLTRKAGG